MKIRIYRSAARNSLPLLHSKFEIMSITGEMPWQTEKLARHNARDGCGPSSRGIITLSSEFPFYDRHSSHELLSSGVSRGFKRLWKRPIDKLGPRKSVAFTVNTSPPPRGISKYARVYTRAPRYTPAASSSRWLRGRPIPRGHRIRSSRSPSTDRLSLRPPSTLNPSFYTRTKRESLSP